MVQNASSITTQSGQASPTLIHCPSFHRDVLLAERHRPVSRRRAAHIPASCSVQIPCRTSHHVPDSRGVLYVFHLSPLVRLRRINRTWHHCGSLGCLPPRIVWNLNWPRTSRSGLLSFFDGMGEKRATSSQLLVAATQPNQPTLRSRRHAQPAKAAAMLVPKFDPAGRSKGTG